MDEITYPFSSCTIEVCKWRSNFMLGLQLTTPPPPPPYACPQCHISCVRQSWVMPYGNNGTIMACLPDRRQAIIWTSAGILLIRPLGTNFSEGQHSCHGRYKMKVENHDGPWVIMSSCNSYWPILTLSIYVNQYLFIYIKPWKLNFQWSFVQSAKLLWTLGLSYVCSY